jgi:hypothetical protein
MNRALTSPRHFLAKLPAARIFTVSRRPSMLALHQAARLKGHYHIAYADAFAAQLAQEKHLPLGTGEPELQALEAAGELTLVWLPL